MTPYSRLPLAVLLGGALVAGFLPQTAHAIGDNVVINEVYARGGSANQPFSRKFVELYNPATTPVSLSGYGLSYSAASNANLGTTCTLTATASIPAKGYYLIDVGSNGTTGDSITADQTCTGVNPSGTAGSFTLVNGTTTVDLVGWGTAVRFEGAVASYTGSNSTPGSITRTNGKDTDNNKDDFTFVALPTPQNSASVPVEPQPPATVTIAEIQGTGSSTPLAGQEVTTKGVVTAAYPTGGFSGIYIQTPGSGGVAKAPGDASDGLFVYSSWAAANTVVGDCVEVKGTAAEYNGLTQLSGRTTVTKITGCDAVKATELATLPATDAAKEVYEGMLVKPLGTYTITNNYQLNQYGQLGLAVGDSPLYQATDVVAPGDAALAYEADNLTRYITLDDGSSWDYMRNTTAQASPLPYLAPDRTLRSGAAVTFTKPVILDYRFQWNFQPTAQIVGSSSPADPIIATETREATPPNVGGNAKLAAFNVLNYFSDLGKDEAGCRFYSDRLGNPVVTNGCQVRGAWSESAFRDQQAKIVSAINKLDADVVGLMEIENSAGITWIGHDRDATLRNLVEALNAAAGKTRWAYVPSPLVTPTNEDVIRTAFIYNPSTVQLLGSSQILMDDAFANARYPLAQKFKVRNNGKPFVAIANHYKSKGSGADDGTGQGLSNPSREAQSRALVAWVQQMFADESVFLLGDFNSYTKETPLQILEKGGFTNLAKTYEPTSTSYQFSGRLGSLDHVFANRSAMKLVTGAGVWDINGDESIAFEYSRRNYNVVDFYDTSPYRSSDHDPVVVGLDTGPRGPKK